MKVKVKYFASLREHIGRAEDTLELTPGTTVGALWEQLAPDTTTGNNIMTAINQEYVSLETRLEEGDEIAFFPPVTGG